MLLPYFICLVSDRVGGNVFADPYVRYSGILLSVLDKLIG